MKTIFINATGTTSGGGLTVLRQFLASILQYDKDNDYYVFCDASKVSGYGGGNIHIMNNVYRRKWIGRILWDNYGIEKWSDKNGIKPDLIVSLQNTGIRLGRKVRQVIYYHQSLPMYEYRWSPLKKQERILWIYKNIYPWFVKKHFYPDDMLVVQSEWMKEASNRVLNIDLGKIRVVKTTLQIAESEDRIKTSEKNDGTFDIIYPASSAAFKNHAVIYQALKLIGQKKPDVIQHLKLYVTMEKGEGSQADISGLDSNIGFLGNLEYQELLRLYDSMDLLVFPSYLETVGLPMLEAAYFGLPVIASDLPYAREAVQGYEGAAFVKYNDPEAWAGAIISAYEIRKKYDRLKLDQRNSWEDMFLLIKQQLV